MSKNKTVVVLAILSCVFFTLAGAELAWGQNKDDNGNGVAVTKLYERRADCAAMSNDDDKKDCYKEANETHRIALGLETRDSRKFCKEAVKEYEAKKKENYDDLKTQRDEAKAEVEKYEKKIIELTQERNDLNSERDQAMEDLNEEQRTLKKNVRQAKEDVETAAREAKTQAERDVIAQQLKISQTESLLEDLAIQKDEARRGRDEGYRKLRRDCFATAAKAIADIKLDQKKLASQARLTPGGLNALMKKAGLSGRKRARAEYSQLVRDCKTTPDYKEARKAIRTQYESALQKIAKLKRDARKTIKLAEKEIARIKTENKGAESRKIMKLLEILEDAKEEVAALQRKTQNTLKSFAQKIQTKDREIINAQKQLAEAYGESNGKNGFMGQIAGLFTDNNPVFSVEAQAQEVLHGCNCQHECRGGEYSGVSLNAGACNEAVATIKDLFTSRGDNCDPNEYSSSSGGGSSSGVSGH